MHGSFPITVLNIEMAVDISNLVLKGTSRRKYQEKRDPCTRGQGRAGRALCLAADCRLLLKHHLLDNHSASITDPLPRGRFPAFLPCIQSFVFPRAEPTRSPVHALGQHTFAASHRLLPSRLLRLVLISLRTNPRPLLHRPTLAARDKMGFGDFTTICKQVSIPLCALVGHQDISGGRGIQAQCYSRSLMLANTLIFEAANDFMHILALVMTVVMIIHVRSKFTAVGRSTS